MASPGLPGGAASGNTPRLAVEPQFKALPTTFMVVVSCHALTNPYAML